MECSVPGLSRPYRHSWRTGRRYRLWRQQPRRRSSRRCSGASVGSSIAAGGVHPSRVTSDSREDGGRVTPAVECCGAACCDFRSRGDRLQNACPAQRARPLRTRMCRISKPCWIPEALPLRVEHTAMHVLALVSSQ